MRQFVCAVLATAVFLSLSCAQEPPTTRPTGTQPVKPLGSTQPASTQPGTQPAGRLAGELIYTRKGGIVGTSDRAVFQPDGALESSGRLMGEHSGKLSAAQVGELAAALGDWSHVAEPRAAPPASDVFTHSITYAGRTLTWTDVTPNIPPTLTKVARWIQDATFALPKK